MRHLWPVVWFVSAVALHAGNATIYSLSPDPIITTLSTKTLNGRGLIIPVGSGSAALVLSSDGNTFYVPAGSSSPGQIVAVDRLSGKTIQIYHTKNPLVGHVTPVSPVPLAVAPDQSQIYVGTCSFPMPGGICQSGNVEVLDVATGQNLAVIPFGRDQVVGIAAAPNGNTVYVAHYFNSDCCGAQASQIPSNAITAIDATSLQPGASLSLPSWTPGLIAITPDSQTGFVASLGFGSPAAVYQIALMQMSLVTTITLPAVPQSMALSGNGAALAVSCLGGYLLFISTATGSVTGPVQTGYFAGNVSILPDGSAAFVASVDIYVVRARSLKVVAQLSIGNALATVVSPNGRELYPLFASASSAEALPQGSVKPSKLLRTAGGGDWLALSPDGGTLYSTSLNSGLVATSTTTGQIVMTLLPGTLVSSPAVSPDGKTLYAVTSGASGTTVAILDASTGANENSIPLPPNTFGPLAITPAGGRLYVLGESDTLVIDLGTLTIIATISDRGVTSNLAISPIGDVVYVGRVGGIDVIQIATNTIIGTIQGLYSYGLAFSPNGKRVYVVGFNEKLNEQGILVIDTAKLAVTNFLPGTTFGAPAVTPDGTLLYTGGSAGVPMVGSIINTRSLQVIATFPSGGATVIH